MRTMAAKNLVPYAKNPRTRRHPVKNCRLWYVHDTAKFVTSHREANEAHMAVQLSRQDWAPRVNRSAVIRTAAPYGRFAKGDALTGNGGLGSHTRRLVTHCRTYARIYTQHGTAARLCQHPRRPARRLVLLYRQAFVVPGNNHAHAGGSLLLAFYLPTPRQRRNRTRPTYPPLASLPK